MKHFNSPVKYVQILLLFLTYKSIGAPLEERMVVFPLRNRVRSQNSLVVVAIKFSSSLSLLNYTALLKFGYI